MRPRTRYRIAAFTGYGVGAVNVVLLSSFGLAGFVAACAAFFFLVAGLDEWAPWTEESAK